MKEIISQSCGQIENIRRVLSSYKKLMCISHAKGRQLFLPLGIRCYARRKGVGFHKIRLRRQQRRLRQRRRGERVGGGGRRPARSGCAAHVHLLLRAGVSQPPGPTTPQPKCQWSVGISRTGKDRREVLGVIEGQEREREEKL